MSAILAASLISGGVSLIKGLFGAAQSAKANKGINKLLSHQPTYKRPEEYAQQLELREKGLNAQRPGEALDASRIGGATSTAYGAAERGAISSNTYGKSVGDIYQKSLNAYQDLGVQGDRYRQTQQDKYANTLQQGANYSDTEYQENVLNPYERELNLKYGDKQSGQQNLFNGIQGMASTALNFMGTKYAQSVMGGLQGGNKGGGFSAIAPETKDIYS